MKALSDAAWHDETERSPDYLSVIDAEDRLVFVNHPQPGETDYLGRSVFDFIDREYHETAGAMIARAREAMLPRYYETKGVGAGGQPASYSNWVFGLGLESAAGLVAHISTEITAQLRATSALELSESTLRSLVDNAPDTIMILDDERKIVFVNHLELGFTDDVLGQPAESFVPPDARDAVVDAVTSVFQTGIPSSYETEVSTPEGARFFETRVGPVILDGRVERVSLVATDITARRLGEQERARLAEQLLQSQKMDAVGQLTGGVAHDFNNLLMAIGGNLQLLMLEQEFEGQAASYIAESLRAVESAAALTRRLLAVSRRQPLAPQVANVNQLVGEMLTLLKRTLGESIAVDADLDPALWSCEVDQGQLEQAILNLALNARDAMPAGGRLRISTSNVTVSSDVGGSVHVPAGQYVALTVTDDGEGMSKEVSAQAFEPFYTTKDVGRGSGLGLSTVYGFVSQSGGHVTLDSTPGDGTTVRILLAHSADAPAATAAPSLPFTQPTRRGAVVLVVEDQAQVRRVSARIVQELGYEVVTAGDGVDALGVLAARSDVTMLFTDIGLPGGVDGLQLAAQVAELYPSLAIVFTSGYLEASRVTSEFPAGVEMLRKPFNLAEAGAVLSRALDRRGAGRPIA